MNRALIIYLALFAVASVSGYSGGAPVEVCDDMKPKHPVDPQKSDSFPYIVTIGQTEVKAGDKVAITIAGGKVEKTFKGFLLQVRSGDKAIGSFVIRDEKFAKTIDCHDAKESAATHRNSTEKETLTVDWIAPAKFQGKVTVYATVAKDGEVFWVRHSGGDIKVN